jgi:hypothetical protein
MQPQLKEIDLSKTTRMGGAGLEIGQLYLVLYDDQMYLGQFKQEWYGLNFQGIYAVGAQYDPPGTNSSRWQRIWQITNMDELISGSRSSL